MAILPISVDSVRLICAHSFRVIFSVGSLGTNHISTAPPAVPNSATKYTEATGGLRSVTPFERRVETLWCGALPTTQVDLPSPPPLLCLCVCVILARFSFYVRVIFPSFSRGIIIIFVIFIIVGFALIIVIIVPLVSVSIFRVFILYVCFLLSLVFSPLFLNLFHVFCLCVFLCFLLSFSFFASFYCFSFFFLDLPSFAWLSLHLRISFPSPFSSSFLPLSLFFFFVPVVGYSYFLL